MPTPFDKGYFAQPFYDLCADYPGPPVYDAKDFRVEWGPVFHRGRLDGTARLLVIGQDPAQHETVIRRILVGTAGRRTQGFIAKLGISLSYVMVNTFLYSVYGQGGGEAHKKEPGIVAYRNKWIKAILASGNIEAVLTLGGLAEEAWTAWLQSADGAASATLPHQHIPHPTSPESAGGTAAQHKALIKAMLIKWNAALTALKPAIQHPDSPIALVPYGDDFTPAELGNIPPEDIPAGMPAWMRGDKTWATRDGADAPTKRRTITVKVPTGVIP